MRITTTAAAFIVLLASPGAIAQPQAKVARIGVLTLSTGTWSLHAQAFRQRLKELGYVEGRNVVIEHRDASGSADALPALADPLIKLKVDVLVTQSNVAALAAKRATRTTPIVMAIAGDPVKTGIIAFTLPGMFQANVARIVGFAGKNRLPGVFPTGSLQRPAACCRTHPVSAHTGNARRSSSTRS